ncbi:hypothetical protein ACFY9A_32125 [Streptomyces rubradiris]|uniref:hypothetical protein n=1 Tax=Streptomyces rubradiris TaxID=285531 RepID=UPI0036ED5B7E
MQLGLADELIEHAGELLTGHRLTDLELHYLARQLTESLREVKRVAESRGARLSSG